MDDIQELLEKSWPEWKIDEKIGEGAFAAVYKAIRQDEAGTRYSAIKIIRIPQDSNDVKRLYAEGYTRDNTLTYYQDVIHTYTNEINLMDKVKGHTNVVSIDDYKIYPSVDYYKNEHPQDEPVWYILIRMELLTPLINKVAIEGINEDQIIKLGIDLCSALEICGQNHIVHRDIKPENIFVSKFGDYKLGDFGVARSLEATTANLSSKGTPNYMPPEVVCGSSPTGMDFAAAAKIDIYSTGMVLYWLSNNSRLPFIPLNKQIVSPKEREEAFTRRIKGEQIPAPARVSAELQRIILKACAFDAKDRYPNATAMKADLEALKLPHPEPSPTKKQGMKKLIVFLLIISLASVLLLKGGDIIDWVKNRADGEQDKVYPVSRTI